MNFFGLARRSVFRKPVKSILLLQVWRAKMPVLDGVSVLVLITASVLVSGIVILKRNPKDILSEMS